MENRYLMTLIDDYSKMSWIYFLKYNFEAFSNFNEYHVSIENKACICISIFVVTMGEDILQMNSNHIYNNMTLNIKLLLDITCNKMMF